MDSVSRLGGGRIDVSPSRSCLSPPKCALCPHHHDVDISCGPGANFRPVDADFLPPHTWGVGPFPPHAWGVASPPAEVATLPASFRGTEPHTNSWCQHLDADIIDGNGGTIPQMASALGVAPPAGGRGPPPWAMYPPHPAGFPPFPMTAPSPSVPLPRSDPVVAPYSLSTSMEEFSAKQLMKDMEPFTGGSQAIEKWPSFWTCIQSIMAFEAYSPLDGLLPDGQLVTTAANASHSKLLYRFLIGKLRSAALDSVHGNPTFIDKGFELVDHLRQTFAPQRSSDVYANFLGLWGLEMSPSDTLDKTVQRLRQYLLALEAGDAKLPPKFQTMFFMRCLDDRFEVLKQAFVIDSNRYTNMSIHELYTAAQSFTTSAKHLLSNSAPPRAAAAAKAPTKGSSSADPTPSKSPSPNKVYSSDDITTMTKEKKCLCGRSGHTLDKCGVIHHAGYCVVLDKAKAQEHWNEVRPPRTKSGGGKGGSAAAASPAPAIGSIKILLDGHVVGVQNVLHVPSLRVPLYSLRAHRHMAHCGFIADNSHFHVYFPDFTTSVVDDVDSYIPYTPLGRTSTSPFDYRQPSASRVARPLQEKLTPESDVATVQADSNATNTKLPPKQPPSTETCTRVVADISYDDNFPSLPHNTSPPHRISKASLLAFLPVNTSTAAPIRPCDTPNGSDTTRHLTADQIYKLFGNRRFKNYANFCITAKDSKFINGGDPVPSLGEFATIPKRKRGSGAFLIRCTWILFMVMA